MSENTNTPLKLSEHFTLDEMQRSVTAEHCGIDNIAYPEAVENLRNLCVHVLEPIRKEYGFPIYVNSGFRSSALNMIVGGAKRSYHLFGRAADVRGSDLIRFKEVVADLVERGVIEPTECIEYSTFIHLAL